MRPADWVAAGRALNLRGIVIYYFFIGCLLLLENGGVF
jgi:hypothetical protein